MRKRQRIRAENENKVLQLLQLQFYRRRIALKRRKVINTIITIYIIYILYI